MHVLPQTQVNASVRTDIPEPPDSALVASVSDVDLGLCRGTVGLVAPSPRWAEAFKQLAEVLDSMLPENVVGIEHIGSTAVPGLPAKAILDIAIGLQPLADPQSAHEWLVRLGFLYRGEREGSRPDLMYGFELEPGVRIINAHVIEHEGPEWVHYVTFRDHLRKNDTDRDAYGALKQQLAVEKPDNRLAYIDGKGAFIIKRCSS